MTHRPTTGKRSRVLAVASGGGHWVQLRRLSPAFADHDVTYVTVSESYAEDSISDRVIVVNDATRWDKLGMIRLILRMALTVARVRPDVVITTGAAPGYWAIRFGKLLGARTLWLDSIANAEALSMAGQLAGKRADALLTQWPHLERDGGPIYRGSVL